MMKYHLKKFIILNFCIFFLHSEDIHASDLSDLSDLLDLPQEAFNVQANSMKFKDLKVFSLINKSSKEKVDNYFNYREGRIKSQKCPQALPDDLAEKLHNSIMHSAQTLPLGFSSFTEPQRRNQSLPKRSLINIDGVTWEIMTGAMVNPSLNYEFLKEEIHDFPPSHNFGRRVLKECYYAPKDQIGLSEIRLMIEDEMMN